MKRLISQMHHSSAAMQRWSLTLLALAATVFFLLLHPYSGLVHDAHLYTIQALNKLHPELYGNDIFLRLGSQDNYTLFPSLHAWVISCFGFEPAAAALTLCSILLFLVACWRLACHLLPAEQAAVALLLIIVVPAYYGPMRVFHYFEEFVTPRQLAEALTLLSLTAWFAGRRIFAVILGGAAMLVHPIIALAGVMFVTAFEWIAPHWRKLWPLAFLAALLATLAIVGWLPVSRWQFDAEWYGIIMNRAYLRLSAWTVEDWGRVATVLATLATAAITLHGRLKAIAAAALITVSLSLLLAFVGGDLLHMVVVVQTQPWRALWLATVLAVLLLPPLFVGGWRVNALTRCMLLLLTAAWAEPYSILALVAAPLAVIFAVFASRPTPMRIGRLISSGCWALLGIAVVHSLAVLQLGWHAPAVLMGTLPISLQKLPLLGQNGVVPALVLLAGGFLALRFPSRGMMVFLIATTATALLAIAYPVARTWATTIEYSNALRESFRDWRARIPEGSEVLWVDSGSENAALNTWLLLERPTFISAAQAPNALFSRTAAIEMARRADSLAGLLPFSNPFRPSEKPRLVTPLRLEPVCRTTGVRFVVTTEILVDARPVSAPASVPPVLRNQKLYICP